MKDEPLTHDQFINQISRLEQENKSLKESCEVAESQLSVALEALRYLRYQLFGPSSEKQSSLDNHPSLFDINDDEPVEDDYTCDAPQPQPQPRPRKPRGKRAPIPAHFPRKETVHKVPDDQMTCDCGCQKVKIGEDVSEQIEFIAPSIYVQRDIRERVACPNCEGMDSCSEPVQVASMPPRLLPKSLAGPSLVAEILTGKFADGLPFFRLEKRFQRLGIQLDRTSMANWARKIGQMCRPLINLLHKRMLAHPFAQIDETTFRVMGESGKSNKSSS